MAHFIRSSDEVRGKVALESIEGAKTVDIYRLESEDMSLPRYEALHLHAKHQSPWNE